MKKFFKYFVIILLLIVFLTISFYNQQVVTIVLLPDIVPYFGELKLDLPLFLIVYSALFIGIACGYVIENLRQMKFRRQASRATKELKKKDAEVSQLKKKYGDEDDEVLALLN